jgi:CRP/FNR family cyclic AMP-dependent transcriptional regulator
VDADRLKAIPLFGGLGRKQLDELAGWADEVDLPAGKALVTEGTFAYEFVIIEEGSAKVTSGGQHLADLGPGDYLGEIGLLAAPRRTASVVTTAPMRAVVMTGPSFRAMVKAMPSVAEQIRSTIDARMSRTVRGEPQVVD